VAGNDRVLRCSSSDIARFARDSLAKGNHLKLSAPGQSMLPCVQDGDVITVVPCTLVDLNLGDVVLYEKGDGSLIAHRLIRIGHEMGLVRFTMMGDNSRLPDRAIAPEQVLGKVVTVGRGERQIALSGKLRRWKGFVRNSARWFVFRMQNRLIRSREILARRKK
jgi:signal peptidase I